jgi:hypothetical protein
VTPREWGLVLRWLLVAAALAYVPVYLAGRLCATGGVLTGAC